MMNIKILYHSSTGNTKKIAQAIADQLNLTAEKVEESTEILNTDILFLGDGNYAGKPSKVMENFVDKLDPSEIKHLALFGTFGGGTAALDKLEAKLKSKGLSVANEIYSCKGKAWLILNFGHPNNTEIMGAKEFAKIIIEKYV